MNINWTIRGVDAQTRLRLRLLAVGRGVSLATLLKQLTDEAWGKDKTIPTPRQKRRMKKIIRGLK